MSYSGTRWRRSTTGPATSTLARSAASSRYYGFISEWSVTYTHWTTNMVPIRAAVSITFTMLPDPPQQTQSAVWQDLQKLGKAPYTVQTPIAIPGVTATSPVIPGVSSPAVGG